MKSATQQKHNSSIKVGQPINILFIGIMLCLLTCAKKEEQKDVLFQLLDHKTTGIDFSNNLVYNPEFNLFKYIYFYNGSGVGAGDFNNDGLIDLFFGSNQAQNKIYINQGKLHFKDVTQPARIPQDGGWTTGISVVDINNDGLLDIYVCRVGEYETLKSKNQLLICDSIDQKGIPQYTDRANEYGLAFSGFSTQAAFLDYDMDGDLDMFLMNHSVHQNGTYRPRNNFEGVQHPLAGDRIFRNDGNKFHDVTSETGIQSTAIGYGLGISVADINLDGYPDIYIGNDFHENDYLYINQKNGTFKEQANEHLMHTSQYSMGVDVADANNDAYPEIISMDMLPADPYILKRSLGDDEYNIFFGKIGFGYNYQYARNNLQYNRGNGMFSEVGYYAGIAATDWSWAPLWVDFDNDGLKDLFVSNGIPKRMNDIDYINFVSGSEVQQKIVSNKMGSSDISLIDKFPEIKIPNKFFLNNGNLAFSDQEKKIGNDQTGFSNGAVYADLDNDGDLDIVVNNIDAPVWIYENKSNTTPGASSLRINLKGTPQNINAVGATVIVYANNEIRTYQKFPAKGFMSSMETPLLIGLKDTKMDSLHLIWPDNTYQWVDIDQAQSAITLTYQQNLPPFNYSILRDHSKSTVNQVADITGNTGLAFLHKETRFNEFDREPLLPHMLSTEGPALAIADINKDGLEDVYVGGARNKQAAIFLQQASGKFIKSQQAVIANDSIYEDVSAAWADVNNDGHTDLVVASGGNEFYGEDFHNSPRVYLNDGKTNFNKLENAFANLYITASAVLPHDFNADGYTDLFIGGRAVSFAYGETPGSYLLLNDKTGRFKDVTNEYAKELSSAGFVTDATWNDIDKDGDQDLLLSLEWGGIDAYLNNNGKFTKKQLTNKKGWWNFLLPVDIDHDGDMDLVVGNLGLNNRLIATEEKPVHLYYNDFDGNGRKEQVITYYVNEKEIPFASKSELEKQIPLLKKKFLYAADFATAVLPDLFGRENLDKASVLSASYFANAILINKGNLAFETKALPWQVQLSTFKSASVVNANNDDLPDILLMGNYYENPIELGRHDADFGSILVNKGNGEFGYEKFNGLAIKGQVRQIGKINISGKESFILAKNNDSLQVIQFTESLKKNY